MKSEQNISRTAAKFMRGGRSDKKDANGNKRHRTFFASASDYFLNLFIFNGTVFSLLESLISYLVMAKGSWKEKSRNIFTLKSFTFSIDLI